MTTMGLGAAKRQTINETVRLRMSALLPMDDEPMDDEPVGHEPVGGRGAGGGGGGSPGVTAGAASTALGEWPATGPPTGAAPLPPAVNGGVGPDAVIDPGTALDPPGAGARPWFGSFASRLVLDRRAVAGLVILLLFAVGYAVQHFWVARPETVAVPTLAAAPALSGQDVAAPGATASGAGGGTTVGGTVGAGAGSGPGGGVGAAAGTGVGAAVVVDIGGRVHTPGLHTLPGGARVADALRAAGGVLPETDTRNLNLARVLTDGEQLLVGEQSAALAPAPAVGTGNGPPGPSGPRPAVSLNRATLEQLDTLPGVGPTLAQRILAYRTSHGSFRSLDQLRQVSGIGARTYEELRPLLTL
ncbi:helix-hairpin-helix domain-containing protein [Kitasatospora sp. NPDC086791]|uniref:helix-hairpin-helix domain-containing protein n=1 Tax=Kitasatospora sp. NPDC086791 TaxID=3155178 RepID=UPI00341FA0A5